MVIKLDYNKGFEWRKISLTNGNIYYKGYFINESDFYEEIGHLQCYDNFVELVRNLEGCFSIIVEFLEEVWAAVDQARTFPIFYSSDGRMISDLAESIRVYNNIEIYDVDMCLFADMLAKRYSSPGNTVYTDIYQLRAGEIIRIKKRKIKTYQYYTHVRNEIYRSYECIKAEFYSVAERMIEKMDNSLLHKKIVLPLSGGYDSRLLACLLKKHGYENVLCYTYGRMGDYEVQYSYNVAKKLEYEWYCVEYSADKWKHFFDDLEVKEYFNCTHNHCALPHVQEYLALSELYQKGLIHSGDVVIPGFCGDVPAGSFSGVPAYSVYDIDILVDYIFSEHYINVRLKEDVIKLLKNKLKEYFFVNNIFVKDRCSFISAYEKWIVESRLTMWVVNSVRVYEHFNLEWRLPMWDKEYLNFWYSVPSDYRENCKLYRKELLAGLFKEYDVAYIKPSPSNTHSNKIKSIIATIIKKHLIWFSMVTGKDFYRRNNINNYNEAALVLLRQLKSRKGYHYASLSVHLIEQLWWCQKVYGKINYEKIVKK